MALQPRKMKKGKLSKKEIKHLTLRDFMGELTPDEVEIAREHGLLVWDLWVKVKNLSIPYEDPKYRAPVFDGYGNICKKKYPETSKFAVKNYDELRNKKTNETNRGC